jgi:UDP-glucose 4-epimerase
MYIQMTKYTDNYILVTGGLGFIGSHVVIKLIELGANVIIVDNLCNSVIDVFNQICDITESAREEKQVCVNLIRADIRNESEIEEIFLSNKIDCVMHFAALKSVSESQKYPELYYNVNVEGTMTLLRIMEKHNCTRFVYSSSATVYGDSESPVTEESRTGENLGCNYAKNKYEIETYIKKLSNRDQNKINFIVLRYFNPIGAHESGLIGENPVGIPNNVFPYLLRVAIEGNTSSQKIIDGKDTFTFDDTKNKNNAYDKFTVFGDTYDTRDGTCIRDYIHVDDLAYAHILSMEKLFSKQMDESKTKMCIYNVGTGKGTTVIELIGIFNEVLKCHDKNCIKYEIGPKRDGDLKECYANVDKIFNELNFKTKHDVEKMCYDGLKYAKIIT